MRLTTRIRVSALISLLVIIALGLALIASVKGAAHAVNSPTSQTPHAGVQTDWPTFGFDPQQDHFNVAESTLSTSNVSTLTQAWSRSTQSGLYSEPVIANGIAYVTASSTTTNTIYAFDATTGTPKGTFQLPGNPSPPYSFGTNNAIVDSGTVYATAGYKFYNHGVLNEGGIIYAFGGNLGTPLWSTTLSYAFTTPKVVNGVIYVGTVDHGMYAYNASACASSPSTCTPLWSKPIGTVTTSPAISNNVIYVGSSAVKNGSTVNTLDALNAADGTYAWTSPALDSTANSVAVGGDGNIYVGTQAGSLSAFSNSGSGCKNGGTCTPTWSYTNSANGYSSVSFANGILYAGADNAAATSAVSAFNASACTSSPSTCAPIWTSANGGSSSNITIANGVLYTGISDTTPAYTLAAFDATGCNPSPCSPIWSKLGTSAYGNGITVVNGTVYAGLTTDGTLRAYILPVSGGTSITLSAPSGPPTTVLTVSGTGFGPNETITISFDNPQTQVTALTDGTGTFPATPLTIPTAAQPGPHTITATGTTSDSAQAAFKVQTNWSLFGFDQQHTHLNPYENTLNSTNIQRTGNFKLAWTASTSNYITTSPLIVNGIVYFGSADHRLYAIDTTTSKRTKTSYNTKNPIYASPAVDNRTLYVTTYTNMLYALDATSINKVEWSAAIGNTKIGTANQSAPVVANGVIYVGGSDHNLYAFSTSGCSQSPCSPLWIGPTGNAINSSPSVANGIVYVGSSDGNLYAFNANGCGGNPTCQPLWSASTGGAIFSSPAIANRVVFVGSSDSILYAFNATTGAPLWTYTTGGEIFSSPAVANGKVYVGSYDHKLYALNATTGKLTWSYTTMNTIQSSPSVANGIVFVGSNDNKLYAFDANAGTLLWSYATKGAIKSAAIIADGMVYVGSYDYKFYAFKLVKP